ncbi:hypothetical protein HC026_09605 [Lactobacillus sp. LC28-10]|uniref:DUF3311 domain-containing protein n=1 Tax=Secundilactobacillus angelensis TaxID=2722706 RepID=A0ABX1KYZ1_9LACO|nr:hypothetical protein [Secundilactobacillus angelensis]MCH5463238.1 hypothetical protein [Secundilactobacillus angelensis]NLR19166.1 hypothetical protein [Secundilactobacillus angelensis]
MKGLAYFLIVLFPALIIGTTVYLTRSWPPTGSLTIVTWTIAWLISMIIVTVLYLLLIHRPNMKRLQNSKKPNTGESKQH